jgi:hypothetical protein
MSPTQKSSLWKQLCGGAAGSVVALGLYAAYAVVGGPIHAMLASAFASDAPQVRQYTDADRTEAQ